MDKEELRKQCEALSDQELYLVINNKRLYNEKIVTAAQIEIRKRAVSKEDMKKFERANRRLHDPATIDIHHDCRLIEKIFLYLICMPQLIGMVTRDYHRQGYFLAARQGRYFGVAGIVGGLSAFSLGLGIHSWILGVITWVSGLILSWLINHNYYKPWIMRKLEERSQY